LVNDGGGVRGRAVVSETASLSVESRSLRGWGAGNKGLVIPIFGRENGIVTPKTCGKALKPSAIHLSDQSAMQDIL
jgi:hypothetical protein